MFGVAKLCKIREKSDNVFKSPFKCAQINSDINGKLPQKKTVLKIAACNSKQTLANRGSYSRFVFEAV